MSKHTSVSIIVCSRSQTRLLTRLFRSLKDQTVGLADCEVLFVDQGGDDNTAALARAALQSLPCRSWETIRAESRYGRGAAYNAGLARAVGDYALLLRPEVRLAPDFLEQCLALLQDNPKLDAAYSSSVSRRGKVDEIHRLPRFDPETLRRRNIVGPAVLMRSTIFGPHARFCESCGYEDWDFWVKAAAAGSSFARTVSPLAFVNRSRDTPASPRADGVAKARIVCNTPGFFEPEVLRWALGLLRQEPWADPFTPGVIPTGEEVSQLWESYMAGSGQTLEEDLSVQQLRSILTGG
jgi:glycosyltransferase involved in cell wall biosynthesis